MAIARRLLAKSVAGTRMRPSPACRARSSTSSRSRSNCSRSRWQCVSVSTLQRLWPAASAFQTRQLQPGLQHRLHPRGIQNFAIHANDRFGAGKANEHPSAAFKIELVAVGRVDARDLQTAELDPGFGRRHALTHFVALFGGKLHIYPVVIVR